MTRPPRWHHGLADARLARVAAEHPPRKATQADHTDKKPRDRRHATYPDGPPNWEAQRKCSFWPDCQIHTGEPYTVKGYNDRNFTEAELAYAQRREAELDGQWGRYTAIAFEMGGRNPRGLRRALRREEDAIRDL